MRKTLSVVLATFNEEKNLPSCLDSLKDIADEIIIVDGTSTDKTVEIAKKYGAKVKITTNKQNFHINKQIAIDMATKDWVLQMDADEHVGKDLKKEILEVLEKDSKEFNGYWTARKNWFLGRFLMKGGQYPDYTLRFYRNGKGRLPQKDVHEQAEVEGKVGYLKSPLLHFPYKNFSHYLKKWNLYNDLLASQIREQLRNKNILQKIFFGFMYLFVRPSHWLFTAFLRHKGFYDLWQGFIFSLFSALRFPVSYIKYIGVYKFTATLIILVAALIRVYGFNGRWGLGGDDSRDALIAMEALKRHELPLTGSFSSAGPFVFGGIFYWFIMLSYLCLPFLINAPWIFLEVLSVLTVALLMYMGKLLSGNKVSIIIGILAATSPQLVVRSLALGQHTFIATFSTLTLISFLLLWKTKKQVHAVMLGIWIGLALNFHYQSINLFIFFPALLFVSAISFKQRVKSIVFALIGFLIPSLPLLYWDWHQNFANIKNLLDYFLIAQYRIYVPNSWKLFIFKYVPGYWSFVVGNFSLLGLVLFLSSTLLFLWSFLKRKLSKEFTLLGIIFLFLLFINRYYKGERSEGYLLYFLPFILIFTVLLINAFIEHKNYLIKFFGILFFLVIIFANFISIYKIVNFKSQIDFINKIKIDLYNKYPGQTFSLYDYKYKLYDKSMPLSLFMSFDNKLNNNGKKLGISCYGIGCPYGLPIINEKLPIVDLDYVKNSDLEKNKKIWINVNQASVYEDLIGWLNKNQLKSTFSIQEYIKSKL